MSIPWPPKFAKPAKVKDPDEVGRYKTISNGGDSYSMVCVECGYPNPQWKIPFEDCGNCGITFTTEVPHDYEV